MNVASLPTVALGHLLGSMADDEFVIGFSDSEWTGIAPLLEEDVAMSSLAQDEIGHAAALYALLGELTGVDPDALAYDRDPTEYRHARLLDHGRGDWAMTIARRYLYETSDSIRLEALVGGSWSPLAQLSAKLVREERYHLMHINAWFSRLASTEGEPRDRLVAALGVLAPDAATVFTPLPGERALLDAGIQTVPMADLEARWQTLVDPVFESHRLERPLAPAPSNGRQGHGAPFAWLWGEFNQVRRSEPGAVW